MLPRPAAWLQAEQEQALSLPRGGTGSRAALECGRRNLEPLRDALGGWLVRLQARVQQDVGGTFGEHVRGRLRLPSDDARHGGGVGHAQAADAAHAQVGVEDCGRVGRVAHAAGRGERVRRVHRRADVLVDLLVGLHRRAGEDLLSAVLVEGCRGANLPAEPDAVAQRRDVLRCAQVDALDDRLGERVGRPQPHAPLAPRAASDDLRREARQEARSPAQLDQRVHPGGGRGARRHEADLDVGLVEVGRGADEAAVVARGARQRPAPKQEPAQHCERVDQRRVALEERVVRRGDRFLALVRDDHRGVVLQAGPHPRQVRPHRHASLA
mmetsp:Transcript_26851/g.80184  ORF Transcript_26851/g.80184 Transcript_26851/m.80184 type:complete len:326 (-) Transcript_26851:949-1926(-)